MSLMISSGILDGSTPSFPKMLTALPLSCGWSWARILLALPAHATALRPSLGLFEEGQQDVGSVNRIGV